MLKQTVNFSKAANVDIRRSKFKIPSRELTTFNVGELVPIYLQEVLPGDTFSMDSSFLARATTSVHPTMDNAYMDVFFFYVPTRLVWDNWQHFNGESDTPWAQEQTYTIPQLDLPGAYGITGVNPNSLCDHFGVFPVHYTPDGYGTVTVNALPFRCYFKIFDDWFRDENLQDAYTPYTGDNTVTAGQWYVDNGGVQRNILQDGSLIRVAKYHDYFTSGLPKPQKGADVLVPAAGFAPVSAIPYNNVLFSNREAPYFGTPMVAKDAQGNLKDYDPMNPSATPTIDASVRGSGNVQAVSLTPPYIADTAGHGNLTYYPGSTLAANLDSVQITVNNLRLAIQTQKLLEKDARGGTRYTEILRSHFGVISPDARLQRSEYLGGKHVPINMAEVFQTSAGMEDAGGNATTPLGTLAGNSTTADVSHDFTKSFVEHGYVIGLCCVRTEHTYSQGLNKIWTKKNRLDFYWPTLANIGEQPIYKRELYWNMTKTDNDVFGYQEAWAEYRYKPNSLSGYFRPGITGSLASWHYGDYYQSVPYLSSAWIMQGSEEFDRTLVYESSVAPQIICDFAFNLTAYRPLPVYSIPGLMDHF